MDKVYRIIYTESAVRDMEEKADYICFNLRDPHLAETWYFRLRTEILSDLAHFPLKYPLYSFGRIHINRVKENPKGVSEMCKVIEEMRKEEREEGIKEGIKEGMRTAALRMLSDGALALEKVAEYVGLSLDEVKKLQAEQSA